MPEQRVVIESKFGVECEEPPVGRGDEGIDLEQRSVSVEKRFIEVGEKLHRLIDLLALESKLESHLARLERLKTHAWIDMLLQDGVRSFRGYLLDIHSSGGRCHEYRLAFRAVHQNSQVQLFFNG